MDTIIILQLLGIIAINAVSNCVGTLKTIFISTRNIKPAYVITFFDAVIFATILKQVSSGNGVAFIIAFALGKVVGMYIAETLDRRMALGILEVDVILNDKDRMIEISDILREKGYTVNTSVSYGYKGLKRYQMEVTLLRKELPVLEHVLKEFNYLDPTFKIKDISKVHGKFTVRGI